MALDKSYGIALGWPLGPGQKATGTPTPTPLFSISTDGWQYVTPTPVDLSFAPVSVARQGFTSTGQVTTYNDTLYQTKRVRKVTPDQLQFTDDRVALSDYVYATDSIVGVTNNSIENSPKPTPSWIMPHRLLVGDSVYWEIIPFHRDARINQPVACVRVRATDGTTATPWQYATNYAISTICEDRTAVGVYRGTHNVSSLADGLGWLEAEVYAWIGGAASVRTTADYSGQGEFSPRYFLKDVARAASPPLAYISPTGVNATGVWSTNPATAKANPFLDDAGARDAIYTTGAAVTGGKADGCRIRAMAGTNVLTNSNSALRKRLDCAALVIERDPDSPRSACIVSFGAAGWNPNTGVKADGSGPSLLGPLTETATLLYDVSVLRTGAGQIGVTTSGAVSVPHFIQYWNVALDNGGQTLTWIAGGQVFDTSYGLSITNGTGGSLQNGTSSRRRMWRGLQVDLANGGLEGVLVVGCELTRPGSIAPTVVTNAGMIAYANRLLKVDRETFNTGASTGVLDRFVIAQNLVEYTGTTSGNRGAGISADSGTVSLVHPIVIHNTATGIGSVGRWNPLYDETLGVVRMHKLQRIAGNNLPQINEKGDEFCGSRGDADAASHVGNFAFEHGVASEGNYTVYVDAGNLPSFRQFYPGMNSKIANGDPLYVDYKGTGGTTASPVAGAGGGDYRLQAGSPARGIVTTAMLGFDLAGQARGTGSQAAGAYV